MADGSRKLILMTAGVLVILVAVAAALLPLAPDGTARRVVGWLLLVVGIIEIVALIPRRSHRPSAGIAAAATTLAGLRLVLDPTTTFFAALNLIILYQVVRSAALAFAAWRTRDSFQNWLIFSAAIDFLLAIGLLAGLPITYLVVGVFGPTPQIIGTFAWVLALSFLATGALLIAAAGHETRGRTPV